MSISSFESFFQLGVRHIFTGYDHLLFLLGLLLVCVRWKTLVVIVTCFTLGHFLTLALATLKWVNLPAGVTEPLIALTILWVGLENIRRGGIREVIAKGNHLRHVVHFGEDQVSDLRL